MKQKLIERLYIRNVVLANKRLRNLAESINSEIEAHYLIDECVI